MKEDYKMAEQTSLANTCNFMNVTPIMMALPYPATQVREQNRNYANLLSVDYCGSVSELTAITQYINHENHLSMEQCPIAKTILGIAMAEMIHLQKLGELICLLGGNLDYMARSRNARPKMWTPQYVSISNNPVKVLQINIEGEQAAINQYRMHMKMINDEHVNAVLARIIKDEEYHIMILKAMLEEMQR